MLQIVADQKLGDAMGSQTTLNRWENTPSARELVHFNAKCAKAAGLGEFQTVPRHAAHNATVTENAVDASK
jgi:hypothetical protein